MKRLGLALALWASLSCAAMAQIGGLMFPGPGVPQASATYTGPGDSQAFVAWGSVSFAYSASAAAAQTNMADLVASTGGAAVCTLKAATTGGANLTGTYCSGTTVPLACAAASGGSCKISKIYDETGNGNHFTQATLGNMPSLQFNALTSIPAALFTAANSQQMISGNITQAQPYTLEAVSERTGNFTSIGFIASYQNGANDIEFAFNSSANSVQIYGGNSPLTGTAADSAAHVLQGTFNGASSTFNVDTSTQITGNAGTSAFIGGTGLAIGVISGVDFLQGYIFEIGVYGVAYNSTVQSNAKSRYGL